MNFTDWLAILITYIPAVKFSILTVVCEPFATRLRIDAPVALNICNVFPIRDVGIFTMS